MPNTREIPREGWAGYLEQVARREKDHPVRLEIVSTSVGSQRLEEHAPLLDVSLEKKGSRRGAIEVTVGGPGGQMLGHHIDEPVHLYAKENAAGEVEMLDIEDREQVKTLLVFEHPMVLDA